MRRKRGVRARRRRRRRRKKKEEAEKENKRNERKKEEEEERQKEEAQRKKDEEEEKEKPFDEKCTVALKCFQRSLDAAHVIAMMQHLQGAQNLEKHRNVIVFLEHFDHDLCSCLAYERVGLSLQQYLNATEAFPSPQNVGRIGWQMVSALEFVSSRGIIHRDVSPYNIALDMMRTRVILLDFGISELIETPQDQRMPLCFEFSDYAPPDVMEKKKKPSGLYDCMCLVITMLDCMKEGVVKKNTVGQRFYRPVSFESPEQCLRENGHRFMIDIIRAVYKEYLDPTSNSYGTILKTIETTFDCIDEDPSSSWEVFKKKERALTLD